MHWWNSEKKLSSFCLPALLWFESIFQFSSQNFSGWRFWNLSHKFNPTTKFLEIRDLFIKELVYFLFNDFIFVWYNVSSWHFTKLIMRNPYLKQIGIFSNDVVTFFEKSLNFLEYKPMTATSETFGCWRSKSSNSAGATWKPLTLMSSLRRSTI